MDSFTLSSLPTSPGVYLFKDKDGQVIYIGKARSLRTRVRSYFKPSDNEKIALLAHEVADIATIGTKNETEALLLEAQLIKENQPKFNVLLKEGQPFIYLLFTHTSPPRLELVRNKNKKGVSFGPFLHKTDARRVYAYLLRTFRLKWCNKKIPGGCLDYHLDLCPGSCTGAMNMKDYEFKIALAQQALAGNFQQFLRDLKERIELHNCAMEFEKSRNLQEYVHNFEMIFATLRTHFTEKKYEAAAAVATAPVKHDPQPNPQLARELQDLFRLDRPVRTIDCFDISHFQSKALVGACIRFTDGVPDKNNFRRFKIRTLTEQNDYAALQEVVRRRYTSADQLPDLILIDGGKGQLSAVKQVMPAVACISLAKKEETIFGDQHPEGIRLDVKTEIGKTLIALRDYTHHFAITYHRTLRARQATDLAE